MRVIDEVYTYGIKEKKTNRILKKIAAGKHMPKLYVVTFPIMGDGQLEIYMYEQLLQPYYARMTDDICVVGIAKNKAGACEIVNGIVQDMCDAGCEDFSKIREFIG